MPVKRNKDGIVCAHTFKETEHFFWEHCDALSPERFGLNIHGYRL